MGGNLHILKFARNRTKLLRISYILNCLDVRSLGQFTIHLLQRNLFRSKAPHEVRNKSTTNFLLLFTHSQHPCESHYQSQRP